MNKYIISGIGPSELGAGRLVKELINYARTNSPNIKVLTFYSKKNILFKYLKKTIFGNYLKLIYYKILQKSNSSREFNNIFNSKILLLHPQTLGFENFKTLHKNNNKIFMYVLDNSYFCIKSFNYIGEFNPCFNCLGKIDYTAIKKSNCEPSPVLYSLKDNYDFLNYIQQFKNDIHFLTQNNSQQDLLIKHFGSQIKTDVVGMYTNEFELDKILSRNSEFMYDFVYHGSLEVAKGILYFITMAEKLINNSFFMPYDENLIKDKFRMKVLPNNIYFKNQSWESGLEETIKYSKIVICPSLWSAPIEGALLKSIMVNGCVAVVETEFAFSQELNQDQIIKLNKDLNLSLSILNNVLNDSEKRTNYVSASQKWLKEYINNKKAKQTKLFDIVFN
jgi:hypothetical protein